LLFISWFVVIMDDTTMGVYRISAVTLRVKDMEKSCNFYSKLPGFMLVYGGTTGQFTTFEVGKGSKIYLNLELADDKSARGTSTGPDKDVDGLYQFMKNDSSISQAAIFEDEPADAPWGERFFHVREPDGYELSFAQPITKAIEKYYCE
jgi:catechol 2,3-dioxygenase-like lactoylglutathione lyase family enzyme